MKLALFWLLSGTTLLAQSTVATGDSRTVTEPSIPTAICAQVQATKYIVQTTAVNIDPFNPTCGSTGGTNGTLGCTGGTSYEPSSASGTYVASETLDNTAVQNALNSCPSGQAVELVAGSAGQLGFVLSPWQLKANLIIDAGVRVFASRNRTDYGGTNCGLVTTGSSSCNHWITSPSTTDLGIYGYGTLDGRGWDAYIGSTNVGFYSNRIQAYCNNHGGASHGSPNCTPNGAGNNSFGPNLINLVGANSFTLYKTTLHDAGNFFVNWQSGNGFTAWDAKIIGPFEVSNTDGWDPLQSSNGTWTHGFISNGDNHMAIKATSSSVSNVSFTNNQTGAGIGISIGSATQNGVSNILVNGVVQNGNLFNDESTGLMIASSSANGGLVNQVTYENVCMVNEQNSIRFYTNYGGQSGSNTPVYHNVLLRNVAVLPSTAPYTTGNSGTFTFQGLSSNQLQVQIDNLSIQGINQGVAQQSGVTKNQYTSYFQGAGAVPSSVISQFNAGTGNVASGSAGSSSPFCTSSPWQPLIGELNLQSAAQNNNQTYSGPAPYTLQAVLQPATEISEKESAALTQPVTFLDNGTPIGTGTLSGDGTLAELTVNTLPSTGIHTYTAKYPGDSNYPAFTFGSVTVNVGTGPLAPLNLNGVVTISGGATLQ